MYCARENRHDLPQIEARKALQRKDFFGPERVGRMDDTERAKIDFYLRK